MRPGTNEVLTVLRNSAYELVLSYELELVLKSQLKITDELLLSFVI